MTVLYNTSVADVEFQFQQESLSQKMSVLEDDIQCWPVATTVAHTGTHINKHDF